LSEVGRPTISAGFSLRLERTPQTGFGDFHAFDDGSFVAHVPMCAGIDKKGDRPRVDDFEDAKSPEFNKAQQRSTSCAQSH
jgi:hypothetical protein